VGLSDATEKSTVPDLVRIWSIFAKSQGDFFKNLDDNSRKTRFLTFSQIKSPKTALGQVRVAATSSEVLAFGPKITKNHMGLPIAKLLEDIYSNFSKKISILIGGNLIDSTLQTPSS
jgi:hypothetical protein